MWRSVMLMWGLFLVAGIVLPGCEPGGEVGSASVDEVVIDTVVRLDFEDAPTLPSDRGIVAWGATTGMFAFVDRRVPWEVIVFSAEGQPVQVVGGRGAGPGEYEAIQSVAFDGAGRLWIISQRGARADVYTTEFELDRSFSLSQRVVAAWPLGDVPLIAVTHGTDGPPDLAYLRPDGTLDRLGVDLPAEVDAQLIRIASDGEGRYWAAVPYEFRVIEGDAHGNWSDLELEQPEWFAATYPAAVQAEFEGMLDTRGATVLTLEYQEDGDLLWITSGVPSSDVDVPRLREAIESGDPERMGDLVAMLIDHVVVAVDPRTRTVVAEGRFDFRTVTERSAWQYEVADDDESIVIQRPVRAR